jgi:hypothetical protein
VSHGTDRAHLAARRHHSRPASHGEDAPVERHRACHDDEILVLPVTQYANLHFLIGLHAAHLFDHGLARTAAAGDRFAVDRNDDVTVANARLLPQHHPDSRASRARRPLSLALSICTPSTAR